ncbi:hypothetical protein [Kinneretia aquatilis]|uniref:hypothetical protein n=1 Tax=Kinneretia aquatilis TaxID=2070761 RepID=UPI001495428C|nr:hypothetical protein [Paucibacter aquatile]WIV98031.1 hypothetical protein K9V56_000565 [Paucibacter aquatile]
MSHSFDALSRFTSSIPSISTDSSKGGRVMRAHHRSETPLAPSLARLAPRVTPGLSRVTHAVLALSLMAGASSAMAFISGSTGADGDLAPAVDTVITLPPSGILNYASINIPAGVKVTFKKNTTNTPVVLLVAGNATIAGTIDVSGKSSTTSGTAGDGVIADDGNPGEGGPGGYSGGRGGRPGAAALLERLGGKGLGPGGGLAGPRQLCNGESYENLYSIGYSGGGGGGFGSLGSNGGYYNCSATTAGPAYGSVELLPLIGGSGGGGGIGGPNFSGSGGGGGGGALLIAVSGTLTVNSSTGKILANGGNSGSVSGAGCDTANQSSAGGGGSGGAIRLIATNLTGNGEISARYGSSGSASCGASGGAGGNGRVRLEAESVTRTAGTTPAASTAQPGPVFIAGTPTLKITSVAGVNVPEPPTGVADVKLPVGTANPVTVTFATTGVPVGNTVRLAVTPNNGPEVSTVSTALAGTPQAATASATIALPGGSSTLQATITYTVVVAMGNALSQFAQGERVERISLMAGLDGRSRTTLITVSGREFEATPEALAMLRVASMGG